MINYYFIAVILADQNHEIWSLQYIICDVLIYCRTLYQTIDCQWPNYNMLLQVNSRHTDMCRIWADICTHHPLFTAYTHPTHNTISHIHVYVQLDILLELLPYNWSDGGWNSWTINIPSSIRCIPMIALWCPAFSILRADFYHAWNTAAYYSYYLDCLLSLPFKGSCESLEMYFRWNSY